VQHPRKPIKGGVALALPTREPITLSRPPNDSKVMKCPKCGKASLKRKESGVVCNFCGYVLSPGEEVKFRLYELLKQSS
jgi:ribosomal protein L37E